jgi:hypothetical protein
LIFGMPFVLRSFTCVQGAVVISQCGCTVIFFRIMVLRSWTNCRSLIVVKRGVCRILLVSSYVIKFKMFNKHKF